MLWLLGGLLLLLLIVCLKFQGYFLFFVFVVVVGCFLCDGLYLLLFFLFFFRISKSLLLPQSPMLMLGRCNSLIFFPYFSHLSLLTHTPFRDISSLRRLFEKHPDVSTVWNLAAPLSVETAMDPKVSFIYPLSLFLPFFFTLFLKKRWFPTTTFHLLN